MQNTGVSPRVSRNLNACLS